MMESNDYSTCSQHPQLPPGFRFHPTDEELVVHYLKKKIASLPLHVSIIAEVDLYKLNLIHGNSQARRPLANTNGIFSVPEIESTRTEQDPNRAATSGYWKATGIEISLF
ncbi:hypothetical protein QQ045_010189 [Rhodiola kirilowii]